MKAIHLTSRHQLNEFMVRIEQAGEGFRLPLIRAAADGSVTVVAVAGGRHAPEHHLKETKPTVVLISDDHPASTGPRRWKQLPKLLHWANAVILHATGGQPQHYELIAATTVIMTRVLVVEMQYRHHSAWLQRVQGHGARVTNIVPPPGDIHPRTAAPAGTVIQ